MTRALMGCVVCGEAAVAQADRTSESYLLPAGWRLVPRLGLVCSESCAGAAAAYWFGEWHDRGDARAAEVFRGEAVETAEGARALGTRWYRAATTEPVRALPFVEPVTEVASRPEGES